ncbi:mechanosensitive ion channel family protein [Orbaceae bacterium ac157xtp]
MQDYLTQLLLKSGISSANLLATIIIFLLIILILLGSHFLIHRVFFKKITQLAIKHFGDGWLSLLIQHKIFQKIALIFQGFLISFLDQIMLNSNSIYSRILQVGSYVWIVVFAMLTFFAVLDVWLELCKRNGIAKKLPIRGFNQSIKIIVAIFVTIIIISILINKSPTLLISGLGAMTAVLMLVFKDPLLGLVAGIQLSTNNMLRVGDWLEMPKYGADGDVIDISLTTVKVQNWDKTITSIPAYALISDSFINWQGMRESGGRRIKRCIYVDTTSVKFLTSEDQIKLQKSHLLKPFIEQSLDNQESNEDKVLSDSIYDVQRLTNIGTFRAYLESFLRSHPRINQEMTLMVRQRSSSSEGVPLEIYCFTDTTEWVEYENIQSDIFDHIFAIISEFGLSVFQAPSGSDIRALDFRKTR